jgi:hydrogenase-4 component B
VARLAAGGAAMIGAALGIGLALPVLLGADLPTALAAAPAPGLSLGLRIDPLSAWFVLVLSVVALPVMLAGVAYTRAYDHHGGPRLAAVTNLFLAAMLLVLLADGAYGFLLAWELMAVASYLLVVHEHGPPDVRRAGFVYLAMTHLGTAFLVVALLILRAGAGTWDFPGLRASATALDPRMRDVVFLLVLIGCGTKAGVIPLHVWLPRAHPVAPSHVSALMSGVMLKVGVYGLVRLIWDVLGGGPAWWGALVLALGLLSAVLGVLYALMEHDLKRLLAFHSIENVGIVLIGLGAGLVLGSLGQPAGAALALGAALFHALNHGLFKALLFLGAGAIQQATDTRDLEQLGGLIRRMPQTAVLFLVGSVAISALPPLNGFASEWLTFQALLAVGRAGLETWPAVGAAVAAGLLGLTGALAAACFVKAFGVAFLALPRSQHAERAVEAPAAMRTGMAMLAAMCVVLGLAPGLATALLDAPARSLAGAALPAGGPPALVAPTATLLPTVLLGALVTIAAAGILLVRLVGGRPPRHVPTWACGYALQPRMQYGSTAFTEPIRLFFRAIVRPERAIEAEYALEPYFAVRLWTHALVSPVFEQRLYGPLARGLLRAASVARVLQSGSLRLYLAYILATLVVLLVWTR